MDEIKSIDSQERNRDKKKEHEKVKNQGLICDLSVTGGETNLPQDFSPVITVQKNKEKKPLASRKPPESLINGNLN
jgi:hypothetical protein